MESSDGQHLEIQLRLQNVVSTVNLGTSLDLTKIAHSLKTAEYNPKRFPAAILRVREPRSTALVFSSGKMIVTGAKNLEESRLAAEKFTQLIYNTGANVNILSFTINNITGTTDTGFPISLEGFQYANAECSTYEPELFPGLVYRMKEPKVVILIFVSGKIVLTGAKSIEDLSEAVQTILSDLLKFRKRNVVVSNRKRGFQSIT